MSLLSELYGRIRSYIVYTLLHPFKKRKMRGFYAQFVKKNSLVFDIGALRGEYTSIFSSLGKKVVSVEPHPYYANKLKNTFTSSNVIVKECAISQNRGNLTLFTNPKNPSVSTINQKFKDTIPKSNELWRKEKWSKEIKVSTITLDDLITEYGVPDFCKIDVEGAEYMVLRGLTQPIPLLSFEYTPGFSKSTEKCVRFLDNLTDENEYYVYNISQGTSFNLLFPHWTDSQILLDKLVTIIEENKQSGDIYCKLI